MPTVTNSLLVSVLISAFTLLTSVAYNPLLAADFYSGEGPGWVLRKFYHVPKDLSDSAILAVCQPNMSAISMHMEHILVPRTVGSQGHADVERYIVSTMEGLGYSVQRHRFRAATPGGARQTFTNIIATWDTTAKRRLILACHYDSKIVDGFVFLGATDSAFPCSAIMETAAALRNYMRRNDKSLDLSLELVFFDGEEAFKEWTSTDSLYGSRRLASDWQATAYPRNNPHGTKRLDQLDLLVLLDLLGSADGNVPNLPENVPSIFLQFLTAQTQLKTLGCLRTRVTDLFLPQTIATNIDDDHAPFQKLGVRVVHLISAPFPSVWHSAADNSSALDESTMHNTAAILRLFTAKYLQLNI